MRCSREPRPPSGAGGGEAGHLLGGVVLDVLQAEQTVCDHAVAAGHRHVEVPLLRVRLAEADRVVGEVPRRRHGGDVGEGGAQAVGAKIRPVRVVGAAAATHVGGELCERHERRGYTFITLRPKRGGHVLRLVSQSPVVSFRGVHGLRFDWPGNHLLAIGLVLDHVPREICFLRVRLAADVTDVRLQVLRVRVFGDVFPQAVLVGVALVAGVAAEGLVGHVAARVRLQVGELREGLATAGVHALVGLLPRVRADVLLQVGQLRELALADLALVRLDPGVDPGMLG